MIKLFLTTCLCLVAIPLNASSGKGMRCTTTQTFVWPLNDPNGNQVEKTVTITHEDFNEDLGTATLYASQSTWKDCRGTLEREFDRHWQQFGTHRAPKYVDEDGRQRPKPGEVCLQYVTNPEVYACIAIDSSRMNFQNK